MPLERQGAPGRWSGPRTARWPGIRDRPRQIGRAELDRTCTVPPAISAAYTPPRPCSWNSGSACASASSSLHRQAAITARIGPPPDGGSAARPSACQSSLSVYASSAMSSGRATFSVPRPGPALGPSGTSCDVHRQRRGPRPQSASRRAAHGRRRPAPRRSRRPGGRARRPCRPGWRAPPPRPPGARQGSSARSRRRAAASSARSPGGHRAASQAATQPAAASSSASVTGSPSAVKAIRSAPGPPSRPELGNRLVSEPGGKSPHVGQAGRCATSLVAKSSR